MFLFDKEYLMERVVLPGGVARYVAEFLCQFYNNPYMGGAVLAILYIIVQQLVWMTIKQQCRNSMVGYLLSFVPALMLWFSMGDENVKLTFAIALVFALVAMSAYPREGKMSCRLLYLAVSIPLLFWFAGPSLLMFVAYVVICECIKSKDENGRLHWQPLLYTAFFFALGMAIVPCPSYRLFYGINYYILIDKFPTMLYVVMAICLVTVFAAQRIPEFKGQRTKRAVLSGLTAALFGATVQFVPLAFDKDKYDVFEYDYLIRKMKWEEIVKKAESTEAKSPLSALSYNLALGRLGQMNRAMQFRQSGWSGAFPVFNKNYIVSLMTNEVYWHLGLVNTSQRFVFEAMEAIPDNNKSSRLIRRLAESNLVNGQYEVARKYLLLLQKTMFYRKWATDVMSMLGDEDAINNHPIYGYLRKCRLDEDFLFSEPEIDKIVGQLVVKNADNDLAVGYLLLLPQLEGNMEKYNLYLNFLQERKMRAFEPNDSIMNDSTMKD